MDPGDREFVRELLLRHEKATDSMIRDMHERTDLLVRRYDSRTDAIVRRPDAQTEMLLKLAASIDEHRRAFVEEMRAQRAALFRMLDRLDGGGSPAGA
jgi:uncharacterized alpha-E superfamily protein